MRRPTSLAQLATVAVLVAGLAGCAGDSGSSGDDAKVWEPASDVPTAPGADGLTPPGAVLEPGAAAQVQMADSILSDAHYFPVEVTVGADAVTTGDRDALVADLEADEYGMVEAEEIGEYVWFVRATITAGPEAAGRTALLEAVDASGDGMDATSSGSFSGCENVAVPEGGGTIETCTVVHGDSDDRPVAVAWAVGPEAYDDDPVLWYLG